MCQISKRLRSIGFDAYTCSLRIHKVHRIPGAVGQRADSVVLLCHGIHTQPRGGAGAVEPRAEVQVRGAGGGASAGELGQGRAGDLLPPEAEALLGAVRRAVGGPAAVGSAKRIVVEALADRPGAVLDDAHAAEVVRHIVEYLVRAATIDQPTSLPGGALQDRCAARATAREDHVPDVQAGRAAVVDLREGAVGEITPLRGGASGGERAGHVEDVPRKGQAALGVVGHVAVVVVGPVVAPLLVRVGQGLRDGAGGSVAVQRLEVAAAVVDILHSGIGSMLGARLS